VAFFKPFLYVLKLYKKLTGNATSHNAPYGLYGVGKK